MALSHFTLPECPNPNCPSHQDPPVRDALERAIGDPERGEWMCFGCKQHGSIMYLIAGGPVEAQTQFDA